jgi:hypothetical protein
LILMTVMLLLGIPIGTDTRSIRLAKVRAWLTAIGDEALPLAFLTTRGYFNIVYFHYYDSVRWKYCMVAVDQNCFQASFFGFLTARFFVKYV